MRDFIIYGKNLDARQKKMNFTKVHLNLNSVKLRCLKLKGH